MNRKDYILFIIDDEEEIRQSLSLLLKSSGYTVKAFKSIEEFFENNDHSGSGCILLDVFLGGKTGLELQEEIEGRFECLPVIFITGHGNVPMSVEALKKGALNFLQKPVDETDLLRAIEEALSRSSMLVAKRNELEKFKSIVNSLTAREYEIFLYIITGTLNKQIAFELRISEHTVKNHRIKITEKLGVKSVAEMIYIAEKLNIKGDAVNY
ncbi:MAG: response regulator transcription factor [Ignavibacteria bacterium]